MKCLITLGILVLIVFISSIVSIVEAHPHTNIDLMESHSHDVNDENFQEKFTLHEFEHVMISTFNWFKSSVFK